MLLRTCTLSHKMFCLCVCIWSDSHRQCSLPRLCRPTQRLCISHLRWKSLLLSCKVVEECAKPFMITLHNIQFQRMLQFLLNLCFCTDQCWWTLHAITFHILLDQPAIPQENAMHSSLKSVEDAALTSEASHTCCVLVFSCHLTGTVSEI